jgi:hypothetical protein
MITLMAGDKPPHPNGRNIECVGTEDQIFAYAKKYGLDLRYCSLWEQQEDPNRRRQIWVKIDDEIRQRLIGRLPQEF